MARVRGGNWNKSVHWAIGLILVVGLLLPPSPSAPPATAQPATLPDGCERTITAKVVALDQPIIYNRLGTRNPVGMVYALRRDVVDNYGENAGKTEAEGGILEAGKVALKSEKRPRPLTLRMNVGDCLQLEFQNLLDPAPRHYSGLPGESAEQPATRNTGLHISGLHLVSGIWDDGSNVGKNISSLAAPGDPPKAYTYHATREGTNLLLSPADNVSSESIGTLAFGLFGAVNVEPKGSEWYRSQLTQREMAWATAQDGLGVSLATPGGHPIMNYDATYPALPGVRNPSAPILKILNANK